MNYDQRKHLQTRLDGCLRVLQERVPKPVGWDLAGAPASIRRLKQRHNAIDKQLSRYRKKEQGIYERARAGVVSRVRAAKEAMLFGDPSLALAEVKKLERSIRKGPR